MRKIRQHNDIDIVVKLKNDKGAVLDPALIKEYKVFLTQLGYRRRIEDYQILPDGGIGFRFHAGEQRIGVYSIIVTAVTTDDRVFTTDVCNAFALVRCSCDAEDGSSDAEIEALEVDASFEITAWSGADEERIKALEKGIEALEKDKQNKIKDLEEIRNGAKLGATALQEYYDDGSHEVVPVKHPDLSTQPSILPYKFAGNYVYEQMVWVSPSDIAIGMKKVDIPTELKPESLMVIDIIGCAQSSQGCKTVDVGATATAEGLFINVVSSISDAKGVWAKIQYCVSPNIGNNYYYQSYIQEEDYIRFFNSLQYAFIVAFHYKTSVSESTSAISVYEGDEFVLEGGMLDDFKNNTMYITLERKDSGAPNVVTLTDGNRKHLLYLGQPLFYSYCSIVGGLTLTQLFDNVERCLITKE